MMPDGLKEIRQQAGYKTAKDLAEEMGVAGSTVTRYEKEPESIPMKHAWAMADLLECSIDEIVGRTPVTSGANELQDFYDGLSREGKALFDEFREFIEARERRACN